MMKQDRQNVKTDKKIYFGFTINRPSTKPSL